GVDVHDPAGVVCIGARIVSRADANWLVVRAGIVPSLATSQWRRAPHQVNVRRIPDMHGICRVHYMLSALAEEILNSFHFRVWRPESPKPALIHCHSPSVAPTSALPWAPDRVRSPGERRDQGQYVRSTVGGGPARPPATRRLNSDPQAAKGAAQCTRPGTAGAAQCRHELTAASRIRRM